MSFLELETKSIKINTHSHKKKDINTSPKLSEVWYEILSLQRIGCNTLAIIMFMHSPASPSPIYFCLRYLYIKLNEELSTPAPFKL